MASNRATTATALLAGAVLIALGIYLNREDARSGGRGERGRDARSDRMVESESRPGTSAPDDINSVLGKRHPARDGLPSARISVSPERVDFGRVSTCGPLRIFEVALANDGDAAVRVDGWISTCACVRPMPAPGFVIEPGAVYTLPIAVEPWNLGSQSHRIDFRASGEGLAPNAAAGRLRVEFEVSGPLRARPAVVTRPESARSFAVNIDRTADDGSFLGESFDVLGVEPRVAQILPPLEPGHGAINIDFQAIDELAASPDAADNPAFEWADGLEGRRWRSIELTVRTSLEMCPEIRVRVRNRGR